MPELSASEWDAFLQQHPDAHFLQARAWGEAKSGFGWQPAWVQAGNAGAQVLFRRLPLGFSIAYLPKGPLGDGWQELWPQIDALCRKRRAVFLKVEPDAWQPDDSATAQMAGFQPAKPIQPPRTVIVSLQGSEEDWLARMKQKTRYNIRLAERKEVVVRPSTDLLTFHHLMQATSVRDGFPVHSLEYYQKVYNCFNQQGEAVILQAEYAGQPLAALMAIAHGNRAWYLYGASSDEERNRMPTYLLQWEAMRWAAGRGCEEYDLYGIPDVDEEALESGFTERSDGLWGVYRFKRGFGGEVRRSVGAWDRVYNPLAYRAYRLYLARRGGEES